jgi:monofunctional biosynthetic peptidoglycan transglycosylase
MKTVSLIIVSTVVLLGFSFVIAQPVNEILAKPGAFSLKLEKPTARLQTNGQDTVHPSPVKDAPGMENSASSNASSKQEQSGSGSRGPGIELFDFSGAEPSWYTLNDNVMGGISNSSVVIDTESHNLSFTGAVSLENNGGFVSTRSQWTGYDLSAFDGIALRVRGDGNTYRFRIRTEETGSAIAYTGLFATEAGTWQEIYIPFSEMVPLYRGFFVSAAGSLDPQSIRSFGLMLSDKQQGEFSLDVDWINAVAESKYEIRYAAN